MNRGMPRNPAQHLSSQRTLGRPAEHPRLLGRRQPAVQRQHQHAAAARRRRHAARGGQLAADAADLVGACSSGTAGGAAGQGARGLRDRGNYNRGY
jgi:hypothetical protein